MKKRILFVDDEPLILTGLRRMLHGQREHWEMEFATSGLEALALLEREGGADAVVSDMRMGGMDGGTLLEQVRARWPRTARIVLSGQYDDQLRTISVAHAQHVLVKPCAAGKLIETIAHALEQPRTAENSSSAISLLERLEIVPSLTPTYRQLTAEPSLAAAAVVRVIADEPGLAPRVLRLAAFLAEEAGRPNESSPDLVELLGRDIINALVLAAGIEAQLEACPAGRASLDGLSAHGLASARCARRIALLETADQAAAGEAFLAGLLHDVGRLVLAANLEHLYEKAQAQAWRRELTLLKAEKACLGVNHAELGGQLAASWGLPPDVVEAIALHHQPVLLPHGRQMTLTAVHAGNSLASEMAGAGHLLPDDELDLAYLRQLGLEARVAIWRNACRQGTPREVK